MTVLALFPFGQAEQVYNLYEQVLKYNVTFCGKSQLRETLPTFPY